MAAAAGGAWRGQGANPGAFGYSASVGIQMYSQRSTARLMRVYMRSCLRSFGPRPHFSITPGRKFCGRGAASDVRARRRGVSDVGAACEVRRLSGTAVREVRAGPEGLARIPAHKFY